MSKRIPFIVGNWKMNKRINETSSYIEEFSSLVSSAETLKDREIGLAPVFTSLHVAKELLSGSKIRLCAQNVHWEDSGQFTGEISAPMLNELGVEYAIIGHSERRKYFGETNETVNQRVKASIRNSLPVIMCVGETIEQRNSDQTEAVIQEQILRGLEGISEDDAKKYITIAYEPVWAIGTGVTATFEQADQAHRFIRTLLSKNFGNISETIRILYGGSVKPDNVDELMSSEDIDGVLVGGASLEVKSFIRIADFK
jgi:triosephosphate isomerase